jgi:hypothetical protein
VDACLCTDCTAAPTDVLAIFDALMLSLDVQARRIARLEQRVGHVEGCELERAKTARRARALLDAKRVGDWS